MAVNDSPGVVPGSGGSDCRHARELAIHFSQFGYIESTRQTTPIQGQYRCRPTDGTKKSEVTNRRGRPRYRLLRLYKATLSIPSANSYVSNIKDRKDLTFCSSRIEMLESPTSDGLRIVVLLDLETRGGRSYPMYTSSRTELCDPYDKARRGRYDQEEYLKPRGQNRLHDVIVLVHVILDF
jgi:hypothetical protein